MNALRLWLLIIGAAVILVYYLWATLKQRKQKSRYSKWGGADDMPLVRQPRQTTVKVPQPGPEVSAATPETEELSPHETETLKHISELISSQPAPEEVPPVQALEEVPPDQDIIEPLETPAASEITLPSEPTADVGLRIDAESEVSAEKIVTLHVVAQDATGFSTKKLFGVLEKEGLVYGNMHIFHMMLDDKGANRDLFSERDVIFSVANMHEPGVFDRDAPVSELVTGIVIFMMIPCAVDAVDGYDIMLNTAYTLANKLDGRVLDSQRSVLTKQAIQSQRDRLRVQELKSGTV